MLRSLVSLVAIGISTLVVTGKAQSAACKLFGVPATVEAYVAGTFQMSDPLGIDSDFNILIVPSLSASVGISAAARARFFNVFWSQFASHEQWAKWPQELFDNLNNGRESTLRPVDGECRRCMESIDRSAAMALCSGASSTEDFVAQFTTNPSCRAFFSCEPCLYDASGRDPTWELWDDVDPGALNYWTPAGEVTVPAVLAPGFYQSPSDPDSQAVRFVRCMTTSPWKQPAIQGITEVIRSGQNEVNRIVAIVKVAEPQVASSAAVQACLEQARWRRVREVTYDILGFSDRLDCHVGDMPGGLCGKKVIMSGPTVLEGSHWGQPEIHPIQSLIVEGQPQVTNSSASISYRFATFLDDRRNTCYPEVFNRPGIGDQLYPATVSLDLRGLHQRNAVLADRLTGSQGSQAIIPSPFCRYSIPLRNGVTNIDQPTSFDGASLCPSINVTMAKGTSAGDWRGAVAAGQVTMGYTKSNVKLRLAAELDYQQLPILRKRLPGQPGSDANKPIRRWHRWKVRAHLLNQAGNTYSSSQSTRASLSVQDTAGAAVAFFSERSAIPLDGSEFAVWTPVWHDGAASNPFASYSSRLSVSVAIKIPGLSKAVELTDSADLKAPIPSAGLSFSNSRAVVTADGRLEYNVDVRSRSYGFAEHVGTLWWKLTRIDVPAAGGQPKQSVQNGIGWIDPFTTVVKAGEITYLAYEVTDFVRVERAVGEHTLKAPDLHVLVSRVNSRPPPVKDKPAEPPIFGGSTTGAAKGRGDFDGAKAAKPRGTPSMEGDVKTTGTGSFWDPLPLPGTSGCRLARFLQVGQRGSVRLRAVVSEKIAEGSSLAESPLMPGAPFVFTWSDIEWHSPCRSGWRPLSRDRWGVSSDGVDLTIERRTTEEKAGSYRGRVTVVDRFGRQATTTFDSRIFDSPFNEAQAGSGVTDVERAFTEVADKAASGGRLPANFPRSAGEFRSFSSNDPVIAGLARLGFFVSAARQQPVETLALLAFDLQSSANAVNKASKSAASSSFWPSVLTQQAKKNPKGLKDLRSAIRAVRNDRRNSSTPAATDSLAACRVAIQGRIPWNTAGNKNWAPENVDRLCQGGVRDEPARCFERLMQGKTNWGGGTTWQWQNAINLCKGSQKADATIACFEGKIRAGIGWASAISACQK